MRSRRTIVLFLILILSITALSAKRSSAQRWKEMDYGPFLTTTIEVDHKNVANKAIAIRLDDGEGGVAAGNAFVAFDTDTLRYAAGWTGEGLIDWKSVVYDGSHQTHPSLVGQRIFVTPVAPGWGNPENGSFEDPRLRGEDGRAYGPLDRDWGKWKGLYRYGRRTILAYTIGSISILDSPGIEVRGGERFLTRTIQMGPRNRDLVLQVACDSKAALEVRTLADGRGEKRAIGLLLPSQSTRLASDAESGVALRLDGSGHFLVPTGHAFNMTDKDFSIVARIRTSAAGTIFSKARKTGPWVRDGKTLFVRGGRLCYDIGWVGAVESRMRINDGQWHNVALTFEASEGISRLYVDGKLQGQKRLQPRAAVKGHVVRIGFTAPDFPDNQSAFIGDIERVRFYQCRLDVAELSGSVMGHDEWKLADWQLTRREGTTVPDTGTGGHTATMVSLAASRQSHATAVAIVGLDNARWEVAPGGCLRLRIPGGASSVRFKLLYAALDKQMNPGRLIAHLPDSPPPGDLKSWTHGGRQLWPEILETKIKRLGEPAGPFDVQTLTLPADNPWRSWIRLGGLDFFADGDRGAVCSWQGDVWVLSGLRQVSGTLRWQRIASGLFQPLGLKIVNDQVLVLGRDQITTLHDLNGDGETDFYENFNNDAQVTDHFHEFAMDLQTDRKGNFYYAKAARHALPALVPQHGTLIQVTPDGSRSRIVARGFRAPDGVLVNDDGTFVVSDQEGHWTPANRINWIRPGGFYGNMMAANPDRRAVDATDPPVCWIHPQQDRSPAAQVSVRGDQWGELDGALLSLSYGTGKIFRVLIQRVGNVVQGGIVQLPLPEFPTGIQRGRCHPGDGMLYVCGLFGWSSNKTQPGGLYRMRRTGQPVRIPDELVVTRWGVLLHFPIPLDRQEALSSGNFAVSRWNYRRTATYGSDDYRVSDGKPGRDGVAVAGVSVSKDGQSVFLHIPTIKECMQMRVRYQMRAADAGGLSGIVDHTVLTLPELTDDIRDRFDDRLVSPSSLAKETRDRRVAPGLVLRIRNARTDQNLDVRLARLVALRAEPNRPLSAFIGPGPFYAEWAGFVRTELSEQVTFQANVLGDLSVVVNGAQVIRATTAQRKTVNSGPVVLDSGANAISVKLNSLPNGAAALRLFWSRKDKVMEPVRPSALVHDPTAAAELPSCDALRLGRQLIATHHCTACHGLPTDFDTTLGMPELQSDSPSLSRVGDRFSPEWLAQWITDPSSMRNDITMPSVFSKDDTREIADIVTYLCSLRSAQLEVLAAESNRATAEDLDSLAEAGMVLYEDLGCIACHHFDGPAVNDPYERTSLHHVGSKYRANSLVRLLRSPHENYAWRRMPDFQLTDDEAHAIAAYLRENAKPLPDAVTTRGDAERGRQAFEERRCLACHAVDQAGTTSPAKEQPLFQLQHRDRGCLGKDADARGEAPHLRLDEKDRTALASFLATDGRSLEHYVPAEAAKRLTERLRCTVCHRRDGRSPERPEILADEGEQGHPAEFLPPLTWTGEKLHTDWVEQMLNGQLAYRTRPWKKARMSALPAFSRPLAEGYVAQHGTPVQRESVGPFDPEMVRMGKLLTEQEKGFHCLQCHALPGKPPEAPFESRGIDFQRVQNRLRYEFFRRWIGNPIQFDTAVPMPRFSPDGKTTTVEGIYGGKADRQFDAIWHYLHSLDQ